ncbi:MAG: polysaccharide biosynthesis C-terminal domain-containing protein [Algicola sp.]|nr:polysaccharide biosynthesis C-terminal domain-containing protein [Algicola sp.]
MNRIMAFVQRYKSYITVFSFTLIGHALGFGREVSIAFLFGASSVSDGILIGLAPLTFFFGIFCYAYANAAMTRIRTPDNDLLIEQTLYPILIVAALVAVVFLTLNEQMVSLFAPGLEGEGKELANQIVMFSAVSAGLSAVFYWAKGIRHLEQSFLRVSISELMPNIGTFIGILLLYKVMGAMGIAIGITLGFFLQFAVVFDPKRINLKGFSWAAMTTPDAKIIYKNTWYAAIGVSTIITSLFVDRYFASELGEGNVAAINFAYKVMTLPLYTAVFAIVIVLYPKLIALRDKHAEFAAVKFKINVVVVALSAVASLVLMLASTEIISLLFQYGEFDASDVAMTAPLLVAYGAGLIAHGLVLFNAKVRFALEDFKTPLRAGLAATVVNIVLDIILVEHYGAQGLAVATSVATAVQACILLFGGFKGRSAAV